MHAIAVKSMQRMCRTKLLNSNMSLTVSAGPATDALKRTAKNEALIRATKRRRTEDPSTLECTKVTKEFDMAAVFAELPTNDEAFPSISWDFDDAFSSDPFPSAMATFPQQDKGVVSPLLGSPTKRIRTGSKGGLVRSKSVNALDSPAITGLPASAALFDLNSDMCFARGLGDSVLSRSNGEKQRRNTPDLCDLLNEANSTGESFLNGIALQF